MNGTDGTTSSATVAQMAEQRSRKATVAGSMPAGGHPFVLDPELSAIVNRYAEEALRTSLDAVGIMGPVGKVAFEQHPLQLTPDGFCRGCHPAPRPRGFLTRDPVS